MFAKRKSPSMLFIDEGTTCARAYVPHVKPAPTPAREKKIALEPIRRNKELGWLRVRSYTRARCCLHRVACADRPMWKRIICTMIRRILTSSWTGFARNTTRSSTARPRGPSSWGCSYPVPVRMLTEGQHELCSNHSRRRDCDRFNATG